MRRSLAAIALASLLVTQSSCFGSFGLTVAGWKFNRDVSSSKWVQELVYLGMLIIPVYEVFFVVDFLVLNTFEFWTGEKAIRTADAGTKDLPDERVVALPDGTQLKIVREDEDTLRVEQGDQVRRIHRTAEGFEALDAGGNVIAKVEGAANGDVEVTDSSGTVSYTAEQVALVGRSAVAVSTWVSEQIRERQQAAAAAR